MRKSHLLLTAMASILTIGGLVSCQNKETVVEKEKPIEKTTKKEEQVQRQEYEINLIDDDLIKVPAGTYSSDLYYNGEYKNSEGEYLTHDQVGIKMLENLSAYLYKEAKTDGTINLDTIKDILSFDYIAYHTNVNNYGSSAVVYNEFIENFDELTKVVDDEKEDAKLDTFYFDYKDLRAPTGSYSSDVYYLNEEHSRLSKDIYVDMLENMNEYFVDSLISGSEIDEDYLKELMTTKFIAYHTNVNNYGYNHSAYYNFVKGVSLE